MKKSGISRVVRTLVLFGSVIMGASATYAEEEAKVFKPIWGSSGSAPAQNAPASRPAAKRAGKKEESVDLGSLTESSVKTQPASSSSSSSMSSSSMHGASAVAPNFKFYFDFMMKYRPDVPGEGTYGFDSYHQLMLVEVMPTNEMTFATELSSAPRYYEMDYQVTPKTTLRWGKIWVPFDDMAPHNIFGGRVNTSKFFESSTDPVFLPDLWADLGVAVKQMLVDTVPLASELHFYIVNGFKSGGSDPTGSGALYPNFQTPATGTDNNNDKAIGTRFHLKFFNRLGMGLSLYRGAWTDKGAKTQSISMMGMDVQFMPTNVFEIRTGLTYGTVGLNPPSAKTSYTRGGAYLEAGYKFGKNLAWKALARTGVVQTDSRVRDNGDKQLLGFTLLRRIGPVETSIQYTKDMEKVAGKKSLNYAHFRIVTAF